MLFGLDLALLTLLGLRMRLLKLFYLLFIVPDGLLMLTVDLLYVDK